MKSVAEFLEAVSGGQRDFERSWTVRGDAQNEFESTAYLAKVARDNGYIQDTNFDIISDGSIRTVRVGGLTALGKAWLSLMRDQRA